MHITTILLRWLVSISYKTVNFWPLYHIIPPIKFARCANPSKQFSIYAFALSSSAIPRHAAADQRNLAFSDQLWHDSKQYFFYKIKFFGKKFNFEKIATGERNLTGKIISTWEIYSKWKRIATWGNSNKFPIPAEVPKAISILFCGIVGVLTPGFVVCRWLSLVENRRWNVNWDKFST